MFPHCSPISKIRSGHDLRRTSKTCTPVIPTDDEGEKRLRRIGGIPRMRPSRCRLREFSAKMTALSLPALRGLTTKKAKRGWSCPSAFFTYATQGDQALSLFKVSAGTGSPACAAFAQAGATKDSPPPAPWGLQCRWPRCCCCRHCIQHSIGIHPVQ